MLTQLFRFKITMHSVPAILNHFPATGNSKLHPTYMRHITTTTNSNEEKHHVTCAELENSNYKCVSRTSNVSFYLLLVYADVL